MTAYRLSNAARSDLVAIAQYGDNQFGVVQSNRYRDRLMHHFELLAEQPFLFPAVDHIRPGYRRSVCGVHAVYYRTTTEVVEIMRILGRQDPSKQLD